MAEIGGVRADRELVFGGNLRSRGTVKAGVE